MSVCVPVKGDCGMEGLPIDDRSRLQSERGLHSIGGGWNNIMHSQDTQKVQGWGLNVIRLGTGGEDR